MGEVVADGLVEVLPADGADDAGAVRHEDAALPVTLAEDHCVADGVVRADGACRRRHHVTGTARLELRAGEISKDLGLRLLEPEPRDRRCGTLVTAAAEGCGQHGGVELLAPAAHDGEHATIHLDEDDQRAGIREVDDLVGEVRDAVDVLRPAQRGDQELLPARVDRLERLHQRVQKLPLLFGEREVQVLGDEVLARTVAQAPGQRVDVALGRRRVGERPRVLVDAEREHRRLEGCRVELALREDADERRRERPVRRDHGSLGRDPVGQLAAVVVEQHLLDRGIERDLLQLPEPRGLSRLDDDESPDRVELEATRLDDAVELVRVQAVEVADVAVQRADGDDRGRVEAARREHRRERVEIGVPMGRDDFFGPHGRIVPLACPDRGRGKPRPYMCATASISTRAPLGSCEMPTVERAGGRSPTCRA